MSRLCFLLTLTFCFPAVHAEASSNFFGDSLTDTGNLFLASGGTAGPLFSPVPLSPSDPLYNPLLPIPRFPAPPYFAGTATNGPIWVQQFAALIGESAPTPSLAGGTNYAFIGATTGPQTVSFFGSPDMQVQVATYLANHSNTASPTDLFAIWGGSNDYFFGQTDPSVTVGNISTIIQDLHAAGARRFVVPNLPNLGATPQGLANFPPNLAALSAQHNDLLELELDSLEQSLNVDIIEVDLETTVQGILDDPAAFGLSNTTEPALALMDDNPLNPLYFFPEFPTVVDPNVDEFLFFDGVHPTTVGHGFIAQTVFETVPEPSLVVPFDIKPGSWPNSVNPKSKGVLPVALVGTETFDVTEIDPSTIMLSMEGDDDTVSPLRWAIEDVATPFDGELGDGHDLDGDGIDDLTLKFNTQEVVESFGLSDLTDEMVALTISGELTDGTAFEGLDWVRKPGKANGNGLELESLFALSVTTVPEPSSIVLAFMGILGLISFGRSRRK